MCASGGAGVAKGVVAVRRGVDRLVRECGFARVGPGDVVALLAPVGFDAATFELWGALANGAAVAGGPGRAVSAAELGGFLARYGVRVLWLAAVRGCALVG